MRKGVVQLYMKNKKQWGVPFFSMEYHCLVLEFLEMMYMVFLSQKVDWNMIFTDYWKVLVLTFSVMGNTVFFSAKNLMERWYLHGLFELSMIFQDLRNVVFRAVDTQLRAEFTDLLWKLLGRPLFSQVGIGWWTL